MSGADAKLARLDPASIPGVASHGRGARAARAGAFGRFGPGGAAAAAWFAAAAVTALLPDRKPKGSTVLGAASQSLQHTDVIALAALAVGVGVAALLLAGVRRPALAAWVRWAAPWLVVSAGLLIAWELLTAKTSTLQPPYWAAPQLLVEGLVDDRAILIESVWSSLRLLLEGYVIGAALGFVTGLAMGWSERANYWLHPILRTIGPIPPVALIPIMFVVLPSSALASLLLVALSAWFPVTILTFSGVASVSRSLYDVAVTLGANRRFLVWRVAVPAAMPSVFVGLFMGLGMTFPTLVVAELLGKKSGLGWYVQWQQGWAAYPKMYVAIGLMMLLFSSLITLLFRVRSRALAWQKGLVRW